MRAIDDGQRRGRAHRLQQVQVLGIEQRVVAGLVDQLDGADLLVVNAHRRAQDRLRGEAALLVHLLVEPGILADVADDLADVVLDAAADDALIALQPDSR